MHEAFAGTVCVHARKNEITIAPVVYALLSKGATAQRPFKIVFEHGAPF